MSASEMLCFSRYFGEMVGDLIPEDDDVWQLYLILREILDIVFSPKFVRGTEVYFRSLVEAFLHLYLNLFHGHLTIKFHLLLHYADLMALLGPLVNLWCMRDEGKHRESRIIAHSTNSRIRLELTVFLKHQLKLCARFMAKRGLYVDFDHGSGDEITLLHFPQLVGDLDQLPVRADDYFLSVSWVRKYGTVYQLNMALIVGEEDMLPVFGEIQAICVSASDDIVFIVKRYTGLGFIEHFHAFHVTEGNAWSAVSHDNLSYPLPLHARIASDGRKLITCRYI